MHPFWPLDNRWFYGDAVFIVEPWLMIALAGICLGGSTRNVARGLLVLIVAGLLVVVWGQARGPGGLVSLPSRGHRRVLGQHQPLPGCLGVPPAQPPAA